MSLDKDTLENAIRQAFQTAKETEKSETESADELQKRIIKTLADNLAVAIDAFVKTGDVVGIETNVEQDPQTNELTGTQVKSGRIE